MKNEIRPIAIKGNLAIITLTKGHEAIIDIGDICIVEGYNWWALKTRNNVYAARTQRIGGQKTTIFMHRAIMGFPVGLEVDHKNGIGLDNTRKNLREATTAQNQHNQRLSSANKSGYKGVFWSTREKKWTSRIRLSGKLYHLGYFSEVTDAHAAYCEASAKLHEEFGRTS